MPMQFVKIYFFLATVIVSFKKGFQNNEPIDHSCVYEDNPELSLKYLMHKRNDNESKEDRKMIDAIKDVCGDLCQTFDPKIQNDNNNVQAKTNEKGHKLFQPPFKHVRCDIIWNSPTLESHKRICVPPRILSDHLEREFSYNYTIQLEYIYYDDSPRRNNNREETQVELSYPIDYTFLCHIQKYYNIIRNYHLRTYLIEMSFFKKLWQMHGRHGIKSQLALFDNQILKGGYGPDAKKRLHRLITKWIHVKDSHILVIGSVNPWIEIILLSEGVKNITTLDYYPYSSDHPKINTIKPSEISRQISNGKTPTFDAMISFSSLEHSGLGR